MSEKDPDRRMELAKVNGQPVIAITNHARGEFPSLIPTGTGGTILLDGVARGTWHRAIDGRFVAELPDIAQHWDWHSPTIAVGRLIDKVAKAGRLPR